MKDFQIIQMDTLKYIGNEKYVSAETLSEKFDLFLENARKRLKRYADKGWLEVEYTRHGKRYRLSGNGDKRLIWLNEKASESIEEFLEDLF
jgi:hypothetical protein